MALAEFSASPTGRFAYKAIARYLAAKLDVPAEGANRVKKERAEAAKKMAESKDENAKLESFLPAWVKTLDRYAAKLGRDVVGPAD